MTVGSGSHRYECVDGWPQLPTGLTLGWIGSVATDHQGRVYCFCRGTHPMVVFDTAGQVEATWGDEYLNHAHGVFIDTDDRLWLTDRYAQVIWVCETDGTVVRRLGYPNVTSADGGFFNHPTNMHLGPDGSVYVSDGYADNCCHRFSADGRLLLSWGSAGHEPGQFNLPHGIWVLSDNRVLVADRENHRIQVFDPEGGFLEQWHGFRQPSDFFVDEAAGLIYLAEVGGRVSILDLDGSVVTAWESPVPRGRPFKAPHGIWVDPEGAIYVGEVQRDDALYKFEPLT